MFEKWRAKKSTDSDFHADIPLDEERRLFLKQLIAQYRSFLPLPPPVPPAGAIAVLDAVVDKAANQPELLSRADYYSFETLLTQVQPKPILQSTLWSLRERFRVAYGKDKYERYLIANPPNVGATIDELRAEALFLLGEIHKYNTFSQGRERYRSGILIRSSLISLCIVLVLVASVAVERPSQDCKGCRVPILRLVLLMSVVGGFVSLQKRIQQIPFEEINQLRYGAFSIYLSPVIAAIFGALYYFALAGGLVSGALFPDLGALRAAVASGAACQSCTDVSRFREIAVNVSRLLVWAFMAGFAERLVPDTIDRFAAKSEGKAT